ncbi:PAS domain S-box protein [Pedobacter jamesrossensis]|uniref:histidine kinase n=1 Tax=Pedobacter jamesrossensis TaxID=1908238 RepID=A0ABV8NJH1_9SPHI
MNFLDSPLFKTLFEDDVPRVILEANVPDYTIVIYNEAYKQATYTTEIDIKGKTVWEAFPKDELNKKTEILEQKLAQACLENKSSIISSFRYDLKKNEKNQTEATLWQLEIEPISESGEKVNYLLLKTINISEHANNEIKIGNYIEREQVLNNQLAQTHEELAASNEELQVNLEDLLTTNEALNQSRAELQLLNSDLESRISQRTKDVESSRHLLQNIVSTANIAMTLLKGEDLIIELPNPKMLQIWQRELIDVDGKKIIDVFPELKEQQFPTLLADVFRTGKRIAMPEVPVDISYPNGELKLIYVDFSYDPIFDKDGKVEYILASVHDITQQVENFKQLEESKSELQATTEELAASNEELSATNEELAATNEELQETQESLFIRNHELSETEESLKLALASGNLGIYSIEPGTGNFEISLKAREFYGLPLEGKVSWKDIIDTVVPKYLPIIEEARIKALATHKPFDVQYPIIQGSTKAIKWMRVVGKSIPATTLKPARFLGVIIDITEEIEHRLAIEESEARFRSMAEATDVFIAEGDATSNATYFNGSWVNATGRSMKDLLEFGWTDLIHPEDKDRYINIYLSAFEKKNPFTSEFRLLNKKGEYIWLLANGTPRFHTDGTFIGYISTAVDISELKKDELRKNDFIGMVSHELKTPLTAISGFVQVLQSRAKKNDDNYALLALNRAYNQVKKMTTMINGFLNVSRLESGKLLIEKSNSQLDELLKELIDESDIVQFSHEIVLSIKEPIAVFADRDKIGSVISNLLSNAVKYSAANTRIDVTCEVIPGNKALVTVKDKGIGIDPEDIEKLFDRYYRVGKHHTVSGFGIGLYLSAEIVERHNGKIGVKSQAGEGSAFYFEIPVGN